MITRIAPTPSGYIHTGNVYNFLLNWLWARSNDGKVLLRIDDGDTERKRAAYVDDIFNVLDWLGLDWDMGPAGPDDLDKNWSQALRKEQYDAALDELVKKKMVFACNCNRSQVCVCSEKELPLLTPHTAWKIHIQKDNTIQIPDTLLGNVSVQVETSFIARKKDGMAAYQVSSLVDDRLFGITHIARGEDLLLSTAMQLYIEQFLSAPSFSACRFRHHALINGMDGHKLSKSAGILSHSIMGKTGKSTLIGSFARWLGDYDTAALGDLIGAKEFTLV